MSRGDFGAAFKRLDAANIKGRTKKEGRPYESIQWLYTAGGRGIGGAQRAAQQAGHTYIGSEHLLLALLREGPERLIRCFFQRRVTAGKTERALLQMVGRGHPTLLESEETTVHYRAAVEEALREAQMGGFLQAGGPSTCCWRCADNRIPGR